MPSYFGERFGERWGMRFSTFGAGVGEDQQPYEFRTDSSSLLARSIYATANPFTFATSFGALPLKASLGYNALRSAWWASKAIGLTSSLKDPFNPMRAVWGYRARTTKGLVSKIVRGVDRAMDSPVSRAFKEGTIARIPDINVGERYFKAGGKATGIGTSAWIPPTAANAKFFRTSVLGEFKRAWKETGVSSINPAARRVEGTALGKYVYSSEVESKILSAALGSEAKGLAARPISMLEKFILRPGNLLESIRRESPSLADYISKDLGDDGFARRIIKNMKSIEDIPMTKQIAEASLKAQEASRTSALGYLRKTFTAKGREEISTSWKKFWGGLEEGEFTKKPILKYTKRKAFAKNVYRSSEALKQTLLDVEGERIAVSAQRKAAGWLSLESTEAMGTMMDKGSLEKLLTGVRGQAMLGDMSVSISRRIGNLKIFKAVGAAAIVAPFVLSAMKTVVEKGMEVHGRVAATMRKMNMMEFGSGEVLTNARLSSDRQRAVSAIQNAQLNARYLMGNEAQLYH